MALDMDELMGEASRLDQKPGEGSFLDNFVKMPEGEGAIIMRILPPARADQFKSPENPNPLKPKLYSGTRIHKVNGKSLHCPRTLQGDRWMGDCPICRWYSHLWGESDKLEKKGLKGSPEQKAVQKQARALKPMERYYYNVIERSRTNEATGKMEKVQNPKPKIYACGKQVHQLIVQSIVGNKNIDEPGLGDVTDLKTGRDFKLIKIVKVSEDGSYPDYPNSKFLDPSPLGTPEEVEEWLNSLHDLHALRKVTPVEDLAKQLKIHNGVIPDDAASDGFNPAEFQKGATVEPARPAPQAAKPQAQAAPAAKAEAPKAEAPAKAEEKGDDGDDSIVEADFMKELRDIA
jgi:hypothetical protein